MEEINRTAMGKPPMPREHGAWVILLAPLASALGISGTFNLDTALLVLSVLCFFIARSSYLRATASAGGPGARKAARWVLVWLALSAGTGFPLLWPGQRWWLIAFAAAAAPIAFQKPRRSSPAQGLAVAGLTLTAPVAWYVATGHLDSWAWTLWLLHTLFFASGFFYVQMHFAAVRQRSRQGVARGTMAYHLLLAALLAGLVAADAIPAGMALCFVPALARAAAGILMLQPTLRIKRLAWTEVAYAILFTATLIAAARYQLGR